jgi:hypothetical protein
MGDSNEESKNYIAGDQYEIRQKLPTILIHRYLSKFKEEERDELKYNLKLLCGKLAEQDIFVPMDFRFFGDLLCSETLDREILFFESTGVIEEIEGSIIYKITEKGTKLYDEDSGLYRGISPTMINTIDDLINTIYTNNDDTRR